MEDKNKKKNVIKVEIRQGRQNPIPNPPINSNKTAKETEKKVKSNDKKNK